MAIEVAMPQMGESVVEGTVTKWLVKEGDLVKEDQPLCEISTDKVDTEIPSPGAGRIAKIVAQEGETIPVGGQLAIIEERDGGRVQEAAPRTSATPSRPEARRAEPPPLRAVGEPRPEPGLAAISPAAAVGSVPRRAQAAPGSDGGAPRRYSPVVLRMAQEHSVDLDLISGTGIDGRVTKRDLQQYLDSLRGGSAAVASARPAMSGTVVTSPLRAVPPAAAAAVRAGGAYSPPVYQPHQGDVTEPFTRRRKLIAEHMVYSKTHSPHVGTLAEIDMTRVTRLREAHKRGFQEREGFGLTLLPLVAAATVRALKEFPRMNAAVVGDSLVIRKEINLGIAMDTEEGLLVPVLKRAEGMSVVGLAREIETLRRKIADRKITADDLAGGSFTLSNPGREGNLFGFAIINQPQMGILRMGELKKRPVVIDVDGEDAIAIRAMMYLALSYDHRVIDGVLGNRFLYRTGKIIEEADFEL
jgi:pyruvate/2-oxoglutarate dehydrogenase complex dihydrolipoamide acyltransferase (E2) component